jgi:glycosyltransferase involved in cell wall biosynthesis
MGGERLRVALFIRSLAGGGAERNLLQLAGGLAARGHAVDLVLGRRAGPFADAIPTGVNPVDLGGPRPLRALVAGLRDPWVRRGLWPVVVSRRPPGVLGCAPALAAYLQRERPPVLLSALAYSNVTALWARRLAGVSTRIVVSERNIVSVRARASREARMRELPRVLAHFYPEADVVTAVSDGVADDVAAVTGIARAKIHTTYSPIVTPQLRSQAAAAPTHPWFAESGPPVVLAVGKLKPQKDFETLLEAFSRVRKQRPCRLLLLGRGPLEARLRARAEALGVAADVEFGGFVANPFPLMARAGVFVLSSAWEGLPSVLVQAMACGCPVVSTDCPAGPAEILEGGRLAPLVPVGDAAALAHAIEGVLAQRPPTAALRARAEDFALDPVLERTLPLLRG